LPNNNIKLTNIRSSILSRVIYLFEIGMSQKIDNVIDDYADDDECHNSSNNHINDHRYTLPYNTM